VTVSHTAEANLRPKRRRLVISDYVSACLEEESLLDEEGEDLSRYQCSRIIHAKVAADFAP
jgi:hypothetical protein